MPDTVPDTVPNTAAPADAPASAVQREPDFTPYKRAEILAPVPGKGGTVDDWVRHFAADALAGFAHFRSLLRTLGRNPAPGSRPDLGYTIGGATSSLAAAIALTSDRDDAARKLWNLTPEAGCLNGENEDWVVELLDRLGINPADIDPAYNASDFDSPSRHVDAVPASA